MPARMLVGRSPTCFLRINEERVSGEHALLQWTGDHWTVRDLGSRNGTYLDGRRLEVGSTETCRAGAKIAFGDPKATHTLSDAGPPTAVAVELKSRQVVEATNGLLALPSAESPDTVIYQDDQGVWVQESKGEMAPAEDQEVLYLDNQGWCLFLPGEATVTPLVHAEKTLAGVSFQFEVSRDEEHVVLSLQHGKDITRLEPREHHYVLLVLARARAKDAELPPAERGWVDKDELQRMLRMRANAMNVAIHRARQQLADAGMVGAAGIVEVRRGLRRFGTDRFEERPLE